VILEALCLGVNRRGEALCLEVPQLRRPDRNSSRLAGSLVGTKVCTMGCDQVWNSQTHQIV